MNDFQETTLVALAGLPIEEIQDKYNEGRPLSEAEAAALITLLTENPLPEGEGRDAGGGGGAAPDQVPAEQQVPAPNPNPRGREDVIRRAIREAAAEKAAAYGVQVDPDGEEVDLVMRGMVGNPLEIDLNVTRDPDAEGGGRELVHIDNAHRLFPILLELVTQRKPVMLIGPTGGGKTSAAHLVAKALNGTNEDGQAIDFFAKPSAMTDTHSSWLGYEAADGYHPSSFRLAFENGGLFVMEESDAGNPAITTIIHTAVENGFMTFPDKTVYAHERFRFIATANTWGMGADRLYVGRNPLDAATLDRFFQMDWDYDENLERQLALRAAQSAGGRMDDAHAWVDYVQSIRARAFEQKKHIAVSPRASIRGAEQIARGVIPRPMLEDMLIWRGIRMADKRQLMGQ